MSTPKSEDESSAAGRRLFQMWMQYSTMGASRDTDKFNEFLVAFLNTYSEFIDIDFSRLTSHRLSEDGPCFSVIPDDLVDILQRQLKQTSERLVWQFEHRTLTFAERLISVLIVLSRDLENVSLLATNDIVSDIVTISETVVNRLNSENIASASPLVSYLKVALHYLECLYDPCSIWRISLKGWAANVTEPRHAMVSLHVQIVPFFYECFQKNVLDIDSQINLFHLFGAIISGYQSNALRAICPALVDVMFKVLQNTVPCRQLIDSRSSLLALKELLLQCIVAVVHIIHRAAPEERQVEIGTIVESYFQTLLKLCDSQLDISLLCLILDKVRSILQCDEKVSLKDVLMSSGVCQHLVTFLHCISMLRCDKQMLAVTTVRVLGDLLGGSATCKAKFIELVGYDQLLTVLKNLGQPSMQLVEALLDVVVEAHHDIKLKQWVHNSNLAVMLVNWLLDVTSVNLQKHLSEALYQLCAASSWNSMQCSKAGIIDAVLNFLERQVQSVDAAVIGNLLKILELTGRMSLSPDDLKHILRLLRADEENNLPSYRQWLIHVLIRMSKTADKEIPLSYFDFMSKDSGIITGSLGQWTGSSFSFHAWMCMDCDLADPTAHRQRPLYSVMTTSGSGFEATLNADNVLVISVCTKKERFTAQVTDFTIADGRWHCVDVVHTNSKRPFGQSQLCVYVDEVLRLTTQLKFPPLSGEATCKIACGIINDAKVVPGHGTKVGARIEDIKDVSIGGTLKKSSSQPFPLPSNESRAKSLWSRMKFRRSSQDAATEAGLESCCTVPGGTAVSMFGQLSEVMVFMEPLLDTHIQALFRLGPNRHLYQTEDASLPADLPYKPLLVYHAKASYGGFAIDLSGNGNNGLLTGRCCEALDLKQAINSIGGVTSLFLLLEQAIGTKLTRTVDALLMVDQHRGSSHELDRFLTTSLSTDDVEREIIRNPVSAFIQLLTAVISNCRINQETLTSDNGLSVVGVLLSKADPSLISDTVLGSIRRLVDSLPTPLRQQAYQYVLFDFHIWNRCQFHVAIAHIQYLHTIVKEDRKFFRKKYGVQYLLDVLRTSFRSSTVSGNNGQTIRGALIDLIKFYVGREILFDELSQILGFICAVHDEVLVCELLDLIILLMELPGKKDQIYLLLFEPGMAELLYVLLTKNDYSAELKEKILKIITLLLKTDRVYERSKTRLRLLDSNLYPGLISLMADTLPSVYMTRHMLEQVFISESASSVNASLYIIQNLCHSDVAVKLEAVRQLLKILLSKPSIPKLFARQLGWQGALVRLFICHANSSSVTVSKWQTNTNHDASGSSGSRPHQLVLPINTKSDDFGKSRKRSGSSGTPSGTDLTVDFDCGPEDDFVCPSSPKFPFDDFFGDPYNSRRRSSSLSRDDDVDGVDSNGRFRSMRPSESMGSHMSGYNEASSPLSLSLSSGDWVQLRYEDADEKMAATLRTMGLATSLVRSESNDRVDQTEELCQNLLIVLFTIMWKGVETTDEAAWKERGQVFAGLKYTSTENELLVSRTELTRKLLELLIQGCIMELKETGRSSVNYGKNAVQLMKIMFNFLCLDDGSDKDKFSLRLLEDLLTLFDLLSLWQVTCDMMDMEQIGLRLLLAFASQDRLELCSAAAARLHNLVQTRPVEKMLESCFIVGSIERILVDSVTDHEERYNCIIPIMNSLLEKCEDMLNTTAYLPTMPHPKSNPSFCEDFRTYLLSNEWKSFMKKQVTPSKEQYEANIYEGMRVQMTAFMGECHEVMMVSGHKRDREKGEGKLKFEEEIVTGFKNRREQENRRYKNVRLQMNQQIIQALHHWQTVRGFLVGEHGIWIDKNSTNVAHWKLSTHENIARMRPKLVPNQKFDQHLEASKLRDNEVVEEEKMMEMMALVSEAHVVSVDVGDDRLGDDEWNLLSNVPQSSAEQLQDKEKLVLKEECELVTIMEVVEGRLEVTTTHIYFFDHTPLRESGEMQDFKWPLDELREIHFRRYNLRRSALEFFLVDQCNFFINFQKEVRNKVYAGIVSLRPPNLIYYQSRSPAELLKSSGLTQKWVQREISNFEYLMHLNTIAGRTYNDLSQYPIFPWILSNYTSDTLDLTDPANYRDLSRPIGVVNPKNEEEVREKFEHFEDPTGAVKQFHYGTHYSNPAGVMHYLIRLEPFTTLHIQLQGGRFDVADRQFHSIPAMWQGLMDNPNDVKELIPEFFYLPEFLVNSNDFDLGRLQILGDKVDDVILPPWAKTPFDFIYKHMQALESDYVSEHLHNWIDLIFGYKQQGPAAADALNVFYYCTYEGAVDLDSISDPFKRKALEGMINNFGQTPCQLIKESHPRRLSVPEVMSKMSRVDRPLPVFLFPQQLKPYCVEAALPNNPLVYVCVPRSQVRSFMQHGMSDSMIAIMEDGTLGTHGWLPYDKAITNYFTFERDALLNNIKTRRRLPPPGGAFCPGVAVNPRMFAVSPDAKLLFFGGNWDNSLRVYSVARSKHLGYVVRHTDIVTCVALDHCGRRLMSGSRDRTCMIWDVTSQGGINPCPLRVLYGHHDEITCVAVSTELDMAVSGSKDGTVIVHTIKNGSFLRTLRPPHEKSWNISVEQLAVSDVGQICVYCRHTFKSKLSRDSEKLTLHLYSVNGKHQSLETIHSPISDMVMSGGHLVFGNASGVVIIKELNGLRTLTSVPLQVPITCITVASGAGHVLAGLRDSNLIVITIQKLSEIK